MQMSSPTPLGTATCLAARGLARFISKSRTCFARVALMDFLAHSKRPFSILRVFSSALRGLIFFASCSWVMVPQETSVGLGHLWSSCQSVGAICD